MSGRLAGKICVITGTGGTMGRATALAFAREGALIAGCDAAVEAARETAELVRDAGGEMVSLQPGRSSGHHDRDASVVVLEYEVHGTSVQTGRPCDNRVVSIVTIADRKVTHGRDHLDPVAAIDASGWPQTHP